jgi:hypothetical protein
MRAVLILKKTSVLDYQLLKNHAGILKHERS